MIVRSERLDIPMSSPVVTAVGRALRLYRKEKGYETCLGRKIATSSEPVQNSRLTHNRPALVTLQGGICVANRIGEVRQIAIERTYGA